MHKSFRQRIIKSIWQSYRETSIQIQQIEAALNANGISSLVLDHFAMIDLPGPYSGISKLRSLFSAIGYVERGRDYLAEKQNDFLWMAEEDSENHFAHDVLPQVVVADFRLDEMPPEIKRIIEKYAHLIPTSSQNDIASNIKYLSQGDTDTEEILHKQITHYLSGRDWPLPTINEFYTVQEFNELLAWVLVFGRRPNHFTLSIHLMNHFKTLTDFHRFIEDEVKLSLNQDGGIIKGGIVSGIAQSSTLGSLETIALHDGNIEIPNGFVEFVWRYPTTSASCHRKTPLFWNDYFTGFIAQHADHVIESLYSISE